MSETTRSIAIIHSSRETVGEDVVADAFRV